jgi:ATP-dependent Clp endopeptidase proteolytic subunit ClpP
MKTIVIDGIVGWDVTGRDVRRQLRAAGGEPVRVEISTPGGFVYDGLEIFNRLRNYSGGVHTHNMSLAASMGSYIALAGDKGKRTAEDNAVYMIHNVWGLAIGDHREMRAEADVLEGLTGLLSQAYAEASGKSVAEIRELMDAETFFFGEEILEAGFVDEITGTSSGAAPDKAGAVAIARGNLDECLARMKESEDRKEDIQKIAAMIKGQTVPAPQGSDVTQGDIPDNSIPASKGGEINQEVVMDLQELKAEHPALYAQVLQEGKEAGKAEVLESVKAHLTMAESTGAVDFAHECIKEGKSVSDQTVVAGYMSAGIKKRDIDARGADSPDGELDTSGDDQDQDEAGAKLLGDVMALSKKTGAPAAPGQEV